MSGLVSPSASAWSMKKMHLIEELGAIARDLQKLFLSS